MNAKRCRNCGKCEFCFKTSKFDKNDHTSKNGQSGLFGSSYSVKLPRKKIPKKGQNGKNETKTNQLKNGINKLLEDGKTDHKKPIENGNQSEKDLVPGWMCKTLLESGKPCKKTYYDKNLIIDHVERFHTAHGQVGKICKVLIKRKSNQETSKPVPKPPEPTQSPPPKKPKDVFRCTYCQYKDKSIDKLHDHITSMHDALWLAQMAKKRKVEDGASRFICPVCQTTTESFQILKDHIDNHDSHQHCRAATRIQSGDSTLPPKSESNPKPKNQQAFFCCYFCTSGPFVNRDLLISHLRNDHSIINNFSNVFSTCYFKSSVSDHSCDENVS